MQLETLETLNKTKIQRGRSPRSRIIDTLLIAKRENNNITKQELYYIALGFRTSQNG